MATKTKKKSRQSLRSWWNKQHWLEKGLDGLLLIGVVAGLTIFIWEIGFNPKPELLSVMRKMDVAILGIFLADFTRNFYKSKNLVTFLKHQWLDLVILVGIIISFSTVAMLGAGRLSWLLREEKVALLLEEGRAGTWLSRLWRVGFIGRIFKR